MSLIITFDTPQEIIVRPEVKKTITQLTVNRIVDIPSERKVAVFIDGDRIELGALSGENYDTPDEWTNATLVDAIKAYYSSI